MNRLVLILWLVVYLVSCMPSSITGPDQTLSAIHTPTFSPSATPSPTPTPIPEVRLATGEQALFNGDFTLARYEFQIAFATATEPELRATALWGLGRIEYREGNYAQVLDHLRQLTSDYPQSQYAAYAYFTLGETYLALDRYSEAANAYSAYLSLRQGVIDYYAQERRGDAYFAAEDYSTAISAYQSALSADHIGDDTRLNIKVAQSYASSGDSTTALEMYDSIAVDSSNDYIKAQIDFLAGQLYLTLNQNEQAYQRFLHAVDNYPLSIDAYHALVALVDAGVPVDELNRGLVDYSAGQYAAALNAFNRYISANPVNNGNVHYYRALTMRELGNYEASVEEFTYFLSNFRDNSHWQPAWDDKATIQWYYLDRYDAAAKTLLDFVSTAPDNPYAPDELLYTGRIYERAGRLDTAASTWERILNEYPNSHLVSQALFWVGIIRYRQSKWDEALVTFQRDFILSTTPEDQARAYFWIGKTQQAKGDAGAANTAWQQAANLNPTGYYSERARDLIFGRGIFSLPTAYSLDYDPATEQAAAEAWIRIVFNLPSDTDLSTPGDLLQDARLIRGTELWKLDLFDEAKKEFEDLFQAIKENPGYCYRLTNYLQNLGLYYSSIFAARQVLTLAGMVSHAQSLTALNYFNHIRYGTYYHDLVTQAAEQNGLNPLFLYSVIRQESLFDFFIHSEADARGLNQILPATGADIAQNLGWPTDYTEADLYRPLVSISFGAYYLKRNQTYFNGDLFATLAAYHAGPAAAEIWYQLSNGDADLFAEIVRYETTRDYIHSVYEIFTIYRSIYATIP